MDCNVVINLDGLVHVTGHKKIVLHADSVVVSMCVASYRVRNGVCTQNYYCYVILSHDCKGDLMNNIFSVDFSHCLPPALESYNTKRNFRDSYVVIIVFVINYLDVSFIFGSIAVAKHIH